MCNAVEANGGEVLKFIGDAMLAIFPVDATRSRPVATRSAPAVAKRGREKENERRAAAG